MPGVVLAGRSKGTQEPLSAVLVAGLSRSLQRRMHEPVVPEVVMNRETGECRKEAQFTLSLGDCLKERSVTQTEEGDSPSWNEGCVLDGPPKKGCQVNANRIKFSADSWPLN